MTFKLNFQHGLCYIVRQKSDGEERVSGDTLSGAEFLVHFGAAAPEMDECSSSSVPGDLQVVRGGCSDGPHVVMGLGLAGRRRTLCPLTFQERPSDPVEPWPHALFI